MSGAGALSRMGSQTGLVQRYVIFGLVQVEHRARPWRRLPHSATHVELLLDERVVGPVFIPARQRQQEEPSAKGTEPQDKEETPATNGHGTL